MATETQAPTTTPVINPAETPWHERHVQPDEICDQQVKELASPDTAP